MGLRRSLCTPISAIFEAAELLIKAVECHQAGDFESASACLVAANRKEVWHYTDAAWGKGAAARYGFASTANSPPHLPKDERPKPRMPDGITRSRVVARDGHHCRFCGIPVIDPEIRKMFVARYPLSVCWGLTNESQHAAFQCMWLQFDHLLPNSRGGDSTLDNIVITCAACNFGRMEATLEEACLMNPLLLDPPIVWGRHRDWDGLECFRSNSVAPLPPFSATRKDH